MKVFAFATLLRWSSSKVLRRPVPAADRIEDEPLADPSRWQSVTILCTPQEIAPDGRLPEPLADLAEIIDTRLELAPGGRGTQLSARTKPGSALWKGENPAHRIRGALQHAKQLIEVGEVLSVAPQPSGRPGRPAGGLLMDLMTGNTDQEGAV